MIRRLPLLLLALATLALVAAGFFFARTREEDAAVDRFARAAVRGIPPADTEAVAMAVARAVYWRTNHRIPAGRLPLYERIESRSPLNVTSAVSLRYHAYGLEDQQHYGPCGTMTRVTLRSLQRLGVPARKLHLLDDPSPAESGHTMLEFRSDGRWLLLSPSDSAFVWRRQDGEIATLREIQADSMVFAQIFERYPGYPYRLGHTRNIRWEKLPAIVRGWFRRLLGARGYEAALTPPLYDEPRRLMMLVSLVTAVVLSVAAVVSLRLVKRPSAG